MKNIYVVYVGIGNITSDDELNKVLLKVNDNLSPILNNENSEFIIIPVRTSIDLKIECINPIYITEEELIRENRLKLDKLHEYLDEKLKEIENE